MLRGLARLILRVGGWTAVGEMPDVPKAVIIAAPHTSNWDGFWALVYKVSIGADLHFFAKHSLFWFPLSTVLRALGAIELDRERAGSAVRQAIDMFKEQDSFFFALSPEGTRSKKRGWKTGFYRIAEGANVPVYLGFFDYKNKRLGIGQRFDLSGDQDADLRFLQEYYSGFQGRWPEKTTPVEFIDRP